MFSDGVQCYMEPFIKEAQRRAYNSGDSELQSTTDFVIGRLPVVECFEFVNLKKAVEEASLMEADKHQSLLVHFSAVFSEARFYSPQPEVSNDRGAPGLG